MSARSAWDSLATTPRTLKRSVRRMSALRKARKQSHKRTYRLQNARTGEVLSHGNRIAYYEYGPKDAETTVVFIHGYTLAADSFYLQVEYLRQHWPEVRLLLIDLRGHGRSEHVDIEECTTDAAADDILHVIDERAPSGQLLLLGHSLGGPVSFAAIRRMTPEMRARLAGLIEVSSAVKPLAQAGLAAILNTNFVENFAELIARDPSSVRSLRQGFNAMLAPILAIGFFVRDTSEDLIDFHAEMIADTPTKTLLGFLDDLQDHDETETVSTLGDVPGYVIVGEQDYVTPISQSEKILELWPEARFQLAQNAGHMLPLEVPEMLNATLDRLLQEIGATRN